MCCSTYTLPGCLLYKRSIYFSHPIGKKDMINTNGSVSFVNAAQPAALPLFPILVGLLYATDALRVALWLTHRRELFSRLLSKTWVPFQQAVGDLRNSSTLAWEKVMRIDRNPPKNLGYRVTERINTPEYVVQPLFDH